MQAFQTHQRNKSMSGFKPSGKINFKDQILVNLVQGEEYFQKTVKQRQENQVFEHTPRGSPSTIQRFEEARKRISEALNVEPASC